MTWNIYLDRNAWLADKSSGAATSQAKARVAAENIQARYISSPSATFFRMDLKSTWQKT